MADSEHLLFLQSLFFGYYPTAENLLKLNVFLTDI